MNAPDRINRLSAASDAGPAQTERPDYGAGECSDSETCGDSIDNDCDGYTDDFDSDCVGKADGRACTVGASGTMPLAAVVLAFAGAGRRRRRNDCFPD